MTIHPVAVLLYDSDPQIPSDLRCIVFNVSSGVYGFAKTFEAAIADMRDKTPDFNEWEQREQAKTDDQPLAYVPNLK